MLSSCPFFHKAAPLWIQNTKLLLQRGLYYEQGQPFLNKSFAKVLYFAEKAKFGQLFQLNICSKFILLYLIVGNEIRTQTFFFGVSSTFHVPYLQDTE